MIIMFKRSVIMILARIWGAYATHMSHWRCPSCFLYSLCPHKIPNIFKISDLHLVRMFVNFMFLDSSSKLLVAPPNIVVITLRLTDTVFSHFVLIL